MEGKVDAWTPAAARGARCECDGTGSSRARALQMTIGRNEGNPHEAT